MVLAATTGIAIAAKWHWQPQEHSSNKNNQSSKVELAAAVVTKIAIAAKWQ